jgi:hypothetical protein
MLIYCHILMKRKMAETLTPHHDEIGQEAERLRQRHDYWSKGLDRAETVNGRAQELREQIARSDDPEEKFSFHDRAFANGEIAQREMLHHAQLHYNANMWEAREHYLQNREEYFDLAKHDAKTP